MHSSTDSYRDTSYYHSHDHVDKAKDKKNNQLIRVLVPITLLVLAFVGYTILTKKSNPTIPLTTAPKEVININNNIPKREPKKIEAKKIVTKKSSLDDKKMEEIIKIVVSEMKKNQKKSPPASKTPIKKILHTPVKKKEHTSKRKPIFVKKEVKKEVKKTITKQVILKKELESNLEDNKEKELTQEEIMALPMAEVFEERSNY